MKTSTASKTANLPAVIVAEVQAAPAHKDWAKQVTSAIKAERSKGRAVLELVIAARDAGIPEEYVRETVRAAYLETGCNKESARKRASDAITVFKSETKAEDMPKNVQEAAAMVRKEKAGTQRAPRTPTAKDEQGEPVSLTPLQMIELGVKGLQQQSNDLGVLSILNEMIDLAADLASRLAKEVKESKAA